MYVCTWFVLGSNLKAHVARINSTQGEFCNNIEITQLLNTKQINLSTCAQCVLVFVITLH